MKNNILKFFIAVFFFCSTLTVFAQGPNDDTSTEGGLENDGDTTGAPIDDYVWVLAAIGLAYVFLRLRALYLQEKTSKE
jgi:hypothetical protein